jgi:hypothetical protein
MWSTCLYELTRHTFSMEINSCCLRKFAGAQSSLPLGPEDTIRVYNSFKCLHILVIRNKTQLCNIIFKHPVTFTYLSCKMYLVLNATIFSFISPPYDMFRPRTAIIRCLVYAKTAALHKIYGMFTYLYTCKCDVSSTLQLVPYH